MSGPLRDGADRGAGRQGRVRRIGTVAKAALAAAVLLAALGLAPAAPAARPVGVTRALDYLHARQGGDGRFQDPAYTPWAILAIAAAGEDPDGAAWSVSGKSPMDYLEGLDLDAHATQGATGNAAAYYSKMIMAYVAAGRRGSLSAAGATDVDLVSRLLAFRRADGRFSPSSSAPAIAAVNTTTWAIIALSAAQTEASARSEAVSWLKGQQLADGGFAGNARDAGVTLVSDVDDTAAAVEALVSAGVSSSSDVLGGARTYLRGAQRSDGGYSTDKNGGYTYSESTAWAIQAIIALGESPASSDWAKGAKTPRTALQGLQSSSGAFFHKKGVLATPLLSTTQDLIALAGKSFASFPRGGTSWITPFVASPRITRITPADDATVRSTTVRISAAYRDGAGGTGIAPSSVRLVVDGHDMTKQASVTASSLSIKLTGAKTGTHAIKVQVRDRAGNARSATVTVTVATGGGSSASTSGSVGTQPGTAGEAAGTAGDGSGASAVGQAASATGGSAEMPASEADVGGTGTSAPEAAFPQGSGSPAAPATTAADSPAANTGSSQSPSGSSGRESAERDSFFLLGLLLVPAAIGFGAASRSHVRWWSATERLRKKTPSDRQRV